MKKQRLWIDLLILILVVGVVIGVDAIRRSRLASRESDMPAGSVPIYRDGKRVASFTAQDIENLEKVEFQDEEKGKIQQGWLLADVLQLYFDPGILSEDVLITVISSSRGKQVTLTWPEIRDPSNHVMFDLSGRGTLKLVSSLEKLDTREEWIQDTDRIEVNRP